MQNCSIFRHDRWIIAVILDLQTVEPPTFPPFLSPAHSTYMQNLQNNWVFFAVFCQILIQNAILTASFLDVETRFRKQMS